MTGTRIYAPAEYRVGGSVELPDATRDHLRARRLRPGDTLTLFDGRGQAARARLERVDKRGATATIEASDSLGAPESPLTTVLLQGMGKSDAMDLVIQKATELGVAHIVPVYTDNSVVRLKGERASRKQGHWERVAVSACEQCGRNTLPQLDSPRSLDEAVAELTDTEGIVISAEATTGFGDLTLRGERVALAVGPEGGFSEGELARLVRAGWRARHLGPRVLRTETAALTGLAALGLRFGDLA